MPTEFRLTVAVARVLREFVIDPAKPRYGYELMQITGYASGKLYPILGRLLRAGWLARSVEDIDPSQEGRPARYTYVLSEKGMQAASQELAALQVQISLPARVPRLQAESGGSA